MSKLLLFVLFILGLKLFPLSESDQIPIGAVIYSLIDPVTFTKNNPGWVLIQGQKIENTWDLMKYYKIDTLLPDLRGYFIRCANSNGLGYDPDITREVGSIQKWGTKAPSNPFNLDKLQLQHKHQLYANLFTLATGGYHVEIPGYSSNPVGIEREYNTEVYPRTSDMNTEVNRYINNIVCPKDHEGGDSETRPTNISLYAYIKVY